MGAMREDDHGRQPVDDERSSDNGRGNYVEWPHVTVGDNETTGENGHARDEIAAARRALEPVQASLSAAGFYAYGMLDEQHRWTIAADDEAGRFDVRAGESRFEVELWSSSPGLFIEEENEFRRRALERLARITIPKIERGYLEPHQHAMWDETDHGVAVRLHYELPFSQAERVGQFVRDHIPELIQVLTFVETRVIE